MEMRGGFGVYCKQVDDAVLSLKLLNHSGGGEVPVRA